MLQIKPTQAIEANKPQENLFIIKEIIISGNTVFSDRQIKEKLQLKIGDTISYQDLLKKQNLIDLLYRNEGYWASGGIILSQELSEGKIHFLVVEGTLSKIVFQGLKNLEEGYLRSYLPKEGSILNSSKLAESLLLLKQDDLIADIKGEIAKNDRNENILLITLKEKSTTSLSLSLNNGYSRSVGRLGGQASISSSNLLGFRDRAIIEQSFTEGLSSGKLFYSIPLNNQNTKFNLTYTRAKSEFILPEIKALGIEAKTQIFKLELVQPIVRKSNLNINSGVSFEIIDTESFILKDFSFSFVEGFSDGKINLRVLRFWQKYEQEWQSSNLEIFSQFSVGLNVLSASNSSTGIDALFWSWVGSVSFRQQYGYFTLINNLNIQLSPDKLVPTEQFSVGGFDQVRGYRTNLASGDNGIINSLNLFFPLLSSEKWTIFIGPFVDFGFIWRNDRVAVGSEVFLSSGLSLQYQNDFLQLTINYGFPLIDPTGYGATETEQNLLFSIMLIPFKF